MAYTPVKTIVVAHNRLTESTNLTVPLSSLARKEAYLVVTQNSASYVLSLGAILTATAGLDLTQPVATALTALLTDAFVTRYTNSLIPVAEASGLYRNRLRVFNPLAYKEYQVHFTSVDTPTILDDPARRGTLDDLVITATGEDLSNCLVAVNGVFHQTRFLNGALYVLDGYRTIRLSGRRDIVVIDTTAVGGHTIIPLTTINTALTAYQGDAVVTLPNSIAGKTAFAVIDGYFYHRDTNVLRIADPTHAKLITGRMPLISQFRHNPRTMHQLDLYGTGSLQSSRKYNDDYAALYIGKTQLPITTFTTQAFQYSRLTAYHSFLVVFNTPNLYTLQFSVNGTGTPRFYYDYADRIVSGMVSYSCGLCPSYLLWRDAYTRTSVFIEHQDNDLDWQDHTPYAQMVPALIPQIKEASHLAMTFYDYVSA